MGGAICAALAQEGAHIAAAAREPGPLASLVGRLECMDAGRRYLAVPTDVTVEDQVAALAQRTLDEFGRIDILVNIAGASGLRGYRYRAAYSASKWAVRGLTRTLALEVGRYNVNVNAVCPGVVTGDRMSTIIAEKARVRGWTEQEVFDEYVHEMALGRFTEGADVAHAVVFLASDESRQITGHDLIVDGGWDV